jgi:hypothetical protein
MTVLTVPPITMSVGDQSFTGSVDDVDNHIAIVTDRTPAGGMNDLTSDTTLAIAIAASYDGGATFELQGSAGPWAGGIIPDKHGNPNLTDSMSTTIGPGTGRLVRLTVTIAGPSSVVAGGTITTS